MLERAKQLPSNSRGAASQAAWVMRTLQAKAAQLWMLFLGPALSVLLCLPQAHPAKITVTLPLLHNEHLCLFHHLSHGRPSTNSSAGEDKLP